ncbi:unnamed protein product, partial [marine sediment metagenome]
QGKEVANLDKLILYTDGASLGNPGRAGIGIVIYNQNRDVIRRMTEFIGINTNNVAEYMALIYALTNCPPYLFTPRCLEALSLPLQECPCPFL